jgi:DNA-binding MarR family transcriptional regulator
MTDSSWMQRKHQFLQKAAKDPKLRGLPLAVAVMLAVNYLNARSETAWPSAQRMADDLKVARRSIRRALDQLVAAGLLVRDRGNRRSNVYALADAVDRLRQQAPDLAKPARRTAKRDPGTPFPEGWQLGNDELKVAHEVAGWDFEKAADEFLTFEAWALDKDYCSGNWDKAWHTWCRRGRDYAAKQSKRRERGGLNPIIQGAQEWLEQERKKTRH